MEIALATFPGVPPEFDDDELIVDELQARGASAEFVDWADPGADWNRYDRVVIRSTWDYTHRCDEFIAWAESLGNRLRNLPDVVRWNSDKRYLGDLADAGLPVVPTRFVAPGETAGELEGEVAVKPTVSAGGRDTGRFGPDAHAKARTLIEHIGASGRTAMVQPYLEAVDRHGETALVFIAGEPAHVLAKRAVLAPDEVAPVRDDAIGAAEVMYDPTLVTLGEADDDEREVAAAIVDHLGDRFGQPPLIARVDLVRDGGGSPVLLELEAIEPNLYLRQAPAAAAQLADAIVAELRPRSG
jgi:glutathione synthase/RimK-type ligase-like ATP-grasp enzyme